MTREQARRRAREEHPRRIDTEVLALVEAGKTITRAQWEEMRINSWERWVLIPFLSDEALALHAERCLTQIAVKDWRPPLTYDESALYLLTVAVSRLRRSDLEQLAAAAAGAR